MKRLSVLIVALVVAGTACDAIGSNVAATANGKDITVDQVTQLAKAEGSAAAKKASANSVFDGETARGALTGWIQLTLAPDELARRGASVESADRQSATQELSSFKGLSTDVRAKLASDLPSLLALIRTITADTKSPEIRKLEQQLYAEIPASLRQLTCSQAIFGPAETADQVQTLLDAGTPLSDTKAFTAAEYQAASANGQYCANPAELPTEVQQTYATAPKGKLERVAFTEQSQTDGSTQNGVIFFKITGARTLRPNDPEILQELQSQMQQNPGLVLAHAFDHDVIHVDPRFGSGFKGAVIAPVAPLAPKMSKKKTAAVAPASAGSASTASNG